MPVLGEVAEGITHRMGELIDVVRILHVTGAGGHFLDPLDPRILAASYVRDVVVTLVLDRTHRIRLPGSCIDIFEILARTGLITHAPDDHGRMVVIRGYHLHHPRHMGVFPLDRMGQGRIAVVIMVALNIGLIHKVDPVLVAEIVPVRSVGIMGVTDMVDIRSLHEPDILFHHLTGNGVAHGRLRLMTVHTAELHRFPIQIEVLPGKAELIFRRGSVLDANLTEAYYCREYIKCLSGSVLQFPDKGITVGSLGGPGLGLGEVQNRRESLSREFGDKGVVVGIQDILIEAICQRQALTIIAVLTGNLSVNLQGSHCGIDPYVTHRDLRFRLESDAAEYSRLSLIHI